MSASIPDPETRATPRADRSAGGWSRRLIRDRDPESVVLTLKLVSLAPLALVPLVAYVHLVRHGDEPTTFAATAAGFGIAILLCWLLPRFAGAVLVVSAVPVLGLLWYGISFGHAWSGEDWSTADVLILVVPSVMPLAAGALLFLAGSLAREYRLGRSHRELVAVTVAAGLVLAAAAGAAVSIDERGSHSADSPAWSPDGHRIAYAGRTLYSNVDRNFGGIYMLPAEGGREQALTRTDWDDLAPAWSPDGSRIAFVRATPTKAFLVVVEVETGASRRLAPALGITPWSFPQPPSWSPDGRRIVFAGAGDRSSDIFVVNADGTGLRNLTRSPAAADHSPAWSPDGRLVAFVSDEGSTGQPNTDDLYVVGANGDGMHRLTRTESADELSPVWSPDGRTIAFVRDAYPADVYVMNADGSGVRGLAASAGSEFSGVAWSPDGRRIGYVVARERDCSTSSCVTSRVDANIYVINLTGGPPESLTHQSDANSYDPAWSPDGRLIAFEREGRIWAMNADGSGAHAIAP